MTSGTHPVCVVIPVYQARLSLAQRTALDRCFEILGRYPIVIAKPASLRLEEQFSRYPNLSCEEFQDEFFRDLKGYNRLLLSDGFYARFAAYEFILIHQLDAFVFSDQLSTWCSRGYDYIGAPWLPPGKPRGQLMQFLIAARRKFYRLIKRYVRSKGHTNNPQFAYSAGNGGFSLRRVAAMRRVLAELDQSAERYRRAGIRLWHEDVFFSVEANRYCTRIRIPDARESAHFSWETNLRIAAHLTKGELPFGCHAWDKLHRNAWRPIFARLGYSIDSILGS